MLRPHERKTKEMKGSVSGVGAHQAGPHPGRVGGTWRPKSGRMSRHVPSWHGELAGGSLNLEHQINAYVVGSCWNLEARLW